MLSAIQWMKADIQPEDLFLVKRQKIAENGQKVVALIDDEATLKEFQYKGNKVAFTAKVVKSKI